MKKTLLRIAFFLVPLGLRLFRIGAAPLWYDEAFTAVLARLPFHRMLAATMGDVHPPLWYAICWAVQRLSLPNWAIRVPAALFGAASCWMLWLLMSKLFVPSRVRMATFILMVISPFQLYFSQEGRMYSLLTFLAITGFWALLESRWTIFSFVCIALLYTHNYGMFYIVCLGAAAFLLNWGNWRKVLVALACAGLAWVAWGGVVLWQMSAVNGSYWIQPPSLGNVLYTLSIQYWAMTMPNKASLPAIYMTDVLVLLAMGYVIWSRPKGWAPILMMAAGPFILALLASWIYEPVFLPRSLAGTAPFLYLLACWPLAAIAWTRRRALYVSCFLLPLAIIAVPSYYLRVATTKGGTDLIDFAQQLDEQFRPGDLICHTGDGSSVIMAAYTPDLPDCKLVSPHEASGALTSITRQAIGIQEIPVEDLQYHRLWLFVAITPMMYPDEVAYVEHITANMQLLRVFNDDEYTWFGVYYAEH